METLFMLLMFGTATFLILLVLVQKGRGGGLSGALGGMGGQSAFGTKAGDLFTKVTIGTATVWILLCVVAVKWLGQPDDPTAGGGFGAGANPPATAPTDGGTTGNVPATSGTATPGEGGAGGTATGESGGVAGETTGAPGDFLPGGSAEGAPAASGTPATSPPPDDDNN